MPRMTPHHAREVLRRAKACGDFHALRADVVEGLLDEARLHGYQKPRNAKGSRARCFHAFLVRVAARAEGEGPAALSLGSQVDVGGGGFPPYRGTVIGGNGMPCGPMTPQT